MMSNSLVNGRNWFETFIDLIFGVRNEIKKPEVLNITKIKVCEVTGDIQVVLKLNKHYFQTMSLNDILTNKEIIAKLSPEAIRILNCLIVKELQISEPIMQDLKLNNLKDDYLMKLYQNIKRMH